MTYWITGGRIAFGRNVTRDAFQFGSCCRNRADRVSVGHHDPPESWWHYCTRAPDLPRPGLLSFCHPGEACSYPCVAWPLIAASVSAPNAAPPHTLQSSMWTKTA